MFFDFLFDLDLVEKPEEIADMLPKTLLLGALAQLRHAKWFQVYTHGGHYHPVVFVVLKKTFSDSGLRPNTMSIK